MPLHLWQRDFLVNVGLKSLAGSAWCVACGTCSAAARTMTRVSLSRGRLIAALTSLLYFCSVLMYMCLLARDAVDRAPLSRSGFVAGETPGDGLGIDPGRARSLQTAGTAAGDPTVDETHSVIFARPPYSRGETSSTVYFVIGGVYLACAMLVLVAFNLDQAEVHKRVARALVPQESVPCNIAEQYCLDDQLLLLCSAQDMQERKQKMNFCSYVTRYAGAFVAKFARQHLLFSLLQSMPTFTRMKRTLLIILEFHICMLTAGIFFNVMEHDKPNGRYELLQCPDSDCVATLPMSVIAGVILCPFFQFCVCRQVRLTCFASQSHPSSSRFPLNVRKFAHIGTKSAGESLFCMRNARERLQGKVIKMRTLPHRLVHALWKTTQASINDLRFYGRLTSWLILSLVVGAVLGSLAYAVLITAYLAEEVVYHWLAWTLTMYFTCTLIFEPLQIFWVEVIWCAIVSNFAQRWGLGANALSYTTKYKEVVRQVDRSVVDRLQGVGATRIQRWWLAVLDMYRAIHEQTAAAVKIQAIRKKMVHQKNYVKERKWCLSVEVVECFDLDQVSVAQEMSPFVRLQCDVGNPTVMQTKVAWDGGRRVAVGESFYIDIKESNMLYVSAWSKSLMSEEFIGRGYFEFSQMKSEHKDNTHGHIMELPLFDIDMGQKRTPQSRYAGTATLRIKFLDPLKDNCGGDGENYEWMLPKHRMQFALSKMGGRMKVGKMLGKLGTKPNIEDAPSTSQAASKSPAAAESAPEALHLPGALPEELLESRSAIEDL